MQKPVVRRKKYEVKKVEDTEARQGRGVSPLEIRMWGKWLTRNQVVREKQ